MIIIGAGPAGPACAVAVRTAGLNATVLEKAGIVGPTFEIGRASTPMCFA